jgi:glutathione S-transferase
MNMLLQFVDLEAARAARGLRLVTPGAIPSPWSEAAKEIFHLKALPVQVVRFRRDEPAFFAWTEARNVPAVLYDDEPPRTGWAEILALAERLGGARSLVPADAPARVRMYGLAHELAGEGGFGWSARLLMVHGGLISDGARGFPLPIARHLAPKYGYAPERAEAAFARLLEVANIFDRQLSESQAAGHRYLLGADLTALDIYLATFLTPAASITEFDCPAMRPEVRQAFAYLHAEIGSVLPSALLAHRAFMFERHLRWPIPL